MTVLACFIWATNRTEEEESCQKKKVVKDCSLSIPVTKNITFVDFLD